MYFIQGKVCIDRSLQHNPGQVIVQDFAVFYGHILHPLIEQNPVSMSLVIKVGVDGVTVDQNTFYENNENPPRPEMLKITRTDAETAKDLFINTETTDITVYTNIYK